MHAEPAAAAVGPGGGRRRPPRCRVDEVPQNPRQAIDTAAVDPAADGDHLVAPGPAHDTGETGLCGEVHSLASASYLFEHLGTFRRVCNKAGDAGVWSGAQEVGAAN